MSRAAIYAMARAHKVTPIQLGWYAARAADKAGVLYKITGDSAQFAWTLTNSQLVAQEIAKGGCPHFGGAT